MYRGILFHVSGKLILVLSGYFLHFYLGRSLSVESYGYMGIILTIINFDYLFLNNGIRQAVSNNIAKDKYNLRDLLMKSLFFEIILISILFAMNYYCAGIIAALLGDISLIPYIKTAAVIIPFLGMYFLNLGTLNGFKLFVCEAIIIMIYPLLKLLVIPCVEVNDKDPVMGVVYGYLLAAAIIFVISVCCVISKCKIKKNDKPAIGIKKYFHSIFDFSVLFSVASLIMSLDLIIVKRFSESKSEVGYYTGVSEFGKAAYYILAAFYLVILPVMSSYHAENRMKDMIIKIKEIMQIILVCVLPVVCIITASSKHLLSLFYLPEYGQGKNALSALSMGMFFLGLTIIFCIILSSIGYEKYITYIAVSMIAIYVPLCVILTKIYSITGAAAATFIICGFFMFFTAYKVKKIVGSFWTLNHTKAVILQGFIYFFTKAVVNVFNVNHLFLLFGLYIFIYILSFLLALVFKIIDRKEIFLLLKMK